MREPYDLAVEHEVAALVTIMYHGDFRWAVAFHIDYSRLPRKGPYVLNFAGISSP